MMRYDIERNRRIRQVRTVVWEDGAARPLLPDSSSFFFGSLKMTGQEACPTLAVGIRYRTSEVVY